MKTFKKYIKKVLEFWSHIEIASMKFGVYYFWYHFIRSIIMTVGGWDLSPRNPLRESSHIIMMILGLAAQSYWNRPDEEEVITQEEFDKDID